MDPAVETVSNSVGMPAYVLDAVRSMQGVKYAVPLYSGGALVKLRDGNYQTVTVIGLDDTSLYGRPELIAGKDPGYLRGEWIHRGEGRGVFQARGSPHRLRV